ncbi:hypothetical protein [Kitasatospora viridis]|uniref:Uncharacterized protein n=1 Tax=Kitasatospora viridis TaxID=281105 RepID=A0A561TVU9_9ACTN|nr:hypothetical protein [Kitasatospora viridis]TWF91235.1 hypothetical protein FHX73_12347 [Kitasatospora viridis]
MSRSQPSLADLPGVWRRTLAREADGSTDRVTDTTWVQGASLFADLRRPPGLDELVGRRHLNELDRPQLLALCTQKAFAGTFAQDGDAFSWIRRFDLHPSAPLPDAGTLHWHGDVLVEEGLHEDYLEHWVPVERPSSEPAAALLRDPAEGCTGLLLRTGSWFGYVRDRSAPLPGPTGVPLADQVRGCAHRAAAAELLDFEVSLGRIRSGHWEITRSTLPHRIGAELGPSPSSGADALRIQDSDPQGRSRSRDWQLAWLEGPVRLLAD